MRVKMELSYHALVFFATISLVLCCSLCCNENEKVALLEFKESIIGNNQWTKYVHFDEALGEEFLPTWKNDTDCCSSWDEVVCDGESGSVIELHLYNWGLNSTKAEFLSPLSNLRNLSYLDFNDNFLNVSSVLSGLATFKNLRYIDLSENSIIGNSSLTFDLQGWDQGSSLGKISYIDLSWCGLSGMLPFQLGNMSSLLLLRLDGNFFTSNFDVLGGLYNLDYLSMKYMDLSMIHESFWSQSLGSMSNVSVLHFSDSSLFMSFDKMTGLVKLPRLRELDLSNSGLQGRIPEFVRNMHSLENLYLGFNNLSGSIPLSISEMPNLKNLFLYNNALNESIPEGFVLPSGLEELYIDSNNLKGVVSEAMFWNATKLSKLEMGNSGLTVNISSDWVPPFSLKVISLSTCKMKSEFPAWISTQVDVRSLDLSNNGLYGLVPSWVWELPKTPGAGLNLSFNHLEGIVGFLGNAAWADLSFNSFSGFGNKVSVNPSPENGLYLHIKGNNLQGELPPIWDTPHLRHLDASNNQLSGSIPPGFTNLTALELISLENNKLQGTLRDDFGAKLGLLLFLNLQNNTLEGPLPNSLRACTLLQYLNLGHNEFNGEFPSWIVELTEIKVMKLNTNNFSGTIPSDIGNMHSLHFIDISGNQISGTIPKSVSNFTIMRNPIVGPELLFGEMRVPDDYSYDPTTHLAFNSKGLYLYYPVIPSALICIIFSHNKIHGEIPTEIGDLVNLKQLNLSNNQLSGSIPESIEKLSGLESLDLSVNMLSGEIPPGFMGLSSLGYLNLSFNNLSGWVPRGGQMLTFSSSAFKGNKYLKDSMGPNSGIRSPPAEGVVAFPTEEDDRAWQIVVGVCFGLGFGGFTLVVSLSQVFQALLFRYMDKLIFKIAGPPYRG